MYFTSAIFQTCNYWLLFTFATAYSLFTYSPHKVLDQCYFAIFMPSKVNDMLGIFYCVCMVHAIVLLLLLCYYPGINASIFIYGSYILVASCISCDDGRGISGFLNWGRDINTINKLGQGYNYH